MHSNADSIPLIRLEPRIQEHDYDGQEIVVDFKHFDSCTFTNCTLIINGFGPMNLTRCKFDDCKWVLAGAAALTMDILQQLHRGGFEEMVKNTLAGIMAPPKQEDNGASEQTA